MFAQLNAAVRSESTLCNNCYYANAFQNLVKSSSTQFQSSVSKGKQMSAPLLSPEFVPASSKIPVLELIPYCGCVCCVTSLYTEFPDCIGCAGSRICLCCYSEYSALKLPMDGDPVWCHWDKGRTYCAPSSTFCMNRGQCFCCDTRCALPMTDDIPVLITCFFFTFYYKDTCGPFECFRTVKELDECAAQLAQPTRQQGPPQNQQYPPQQQPYPGQPYNPQHYPPQQYPPQQYPPQQYPPQQYPPQQYYAGQGQPGQPYPPQQYANMPPPQQQQGYIPPSSPHQNQPPPEQYMPQQTTSSPLAPPVVSE